MYLAKPGAAEVRGEARRSTEIEALEDGAVVTGHEVEWVGDWPSYPGVTETSRFESSILDRNELARATYRRASAVARTSGRSGALPGSRCGSSPMKRIRGGARELHQPGTDSW